MNERSTAGPDEAAGQKSPQRDGDVTVDKDGKVHQQPHGSMDETMIPQKPEPDAGPYEPAPDHLDNPKDVEPRGKDDLSA